MGDDKKPAWEPSYWTRVAIQLAAAIIANVIAVGVADYLLG